MRIKRSWLMIVLGAVAAAMIVYTVAREVAGFSFGQAFDDNWFNGVLIIALGVFLLNRRIRDDVKPEDDEPVAPSSAASETGAPNSDEPPAPAP